VGLPLEQSSDRFVEQRIRFPALDQYQLVGTFYEPAGSVTPLRVVVFNTGAGIAAVRYRRFARFIASCGVPVLTYDYRGIGESRPPRLPGFPAVLEDWTEHDCGGAIAWLRGRYPGAEMIGVGHSVGTVLFGGAPNISELTRFVMICPHTGFVGDYRAGYRLPMALLWHGVMPALTHLFGYFPARLLGLGDDIPSGIALQWAARRTPELRPEATDPSGKRGQLVIARWTNLQQPALLVSIRDDAFATETAVRRFMLNFPNLRAQRWIISHDEVGVRRLGHFGIFRAAARSSVWPRLLAHIVNGDLQSATVDRASNADWMGSPSLAPSRDADNSENEIVDGAVRADRRERVGRT
jgi:predicted alpha/beta hydrolase